MGLASVSNVEVEDGHHFGNNKDEYQLCDGTYAEWIAVMKIQQGWNIGDRIVALNVFY